VVSATVSHGLGCTRPPRLAPHLWVGCRSQTPQQTCDTQTRRSTPGVDCPEELELRTAHLARAVDQCVVTPSLLPCCTEKSPAKGARAQTQAQEVHLGQTVTVTWSLQGGYLRSGQPQGGSPPGPAGFEALLSTS
jgi:hypothetical protein